MLDQSITDYTQDGKCSNCGSCCNDLLPLTPADKVRIFQYVTKHGIKEQRHNVVAGVDVTCPFRDEAKRRCTIYPVRPQICRQFRCDDELENTLFYKRTMMRHYPPVNMRRLFFQNDEVSDFFLALDSMVQTVQTRK